MAILCPLKMMIYGILACIKYAQSMKNGKFGWVEDYEFKGTLTNSSVRKFNIDMIALRQRPLIARRAAVTEAKAISYEPLVSRVRRKVTGLLFQKPAA